MLELKRVQSVLNVTICRPEVRNAFNDELIAALSEVFADPQGARAIVVRGDGPAFCAGGDLQWMKKAAAYTREQNVADALALARMLDHVARCPAVVLAKVQGAAFGGGCGLVAACDVAVALPGTKFSFSEVKLGLVPATISTIVLQKIGHGHARSLFATGEVFDSERALRMGLVHELATDPHHAEELIAMKVRSILASGPKAVHTSKNLAMDGPLELEATAALLADARAGEEGREGVAAFLERRPASFVEEI